MLNIALINYSILLSQSPLSMPSHTRIIACGHNDHTNAQNT